MADLIARVSPKGGFQTVTINPTVEDLHSNLIGVPFGAPINVPMFPPGIHVGTAPEFTSYFEWYYNRIWVIPARVELQNPRAGMAFQLTVWNTYGVSNQLQDINTTNVEGLETDFVYPTTFDAYQSQIVTMTIGDSAGNIDGNLIFDFATGEGYSYIIANILNILQSQPEIPVMEYVKYVTVINPTYDGTEQRAMLRVIPQIRMQFSTIIENDAQRRQWLNFSIGMLGRTILVPMYQYGARVTQLAAEGDTEIKFDTGSMLLHVTDYIVAFNAYNNEQVVGRVSQINADGVIVDAPLGGTIGDTWLVCPCTNMAVADKRVIGMMAIGGEFEIEVETNNGYSIERDGGYLVEPPRYEGMYVLDKRPLANDRVDETYTRSITIRDNNTAPRLLEQERLYDGSSGERFFVTQRGKPFDYWRAFMHETRGMAVKFLMPTWRNELPPVRPLEPDSANIFIGEPLYVEWFKDERYRLIMLETEGGIVYRRVNEAYDQGDGTALIIVNALSGTDPRFLNVKRISLMLTTRLSTDEFEFEHGMLDTRVRIEIETVNE